MEVEVDEDLISTVVSTLRDNAHLNATMRRIEVLHAAGRATHADRRAYAAHWMAATLRRSPGRAAYLPPVADDLLVERAWLESEVRKGQVFAAVRDAFVPARSEEVPATAHG